MDQINDTVFQGWSQMHSLLFWMVSVMINHWKLKEVNHNTMVMDGSFVFGNDGQSPYATPTIISLHNHQQNTNRGHDKLSTPIKQPLAINLQPKPKSSRKKHQLATIDTSTSYSLKDRKIVVKKQSLTLMKNHMLSWKQKLSNKPTMDDQISPTTTTSKRFFLRRLSSGNNNINNSDSSSSKSELPSPTVSILKTISFKLKRQQDNVTDDNSVENYNSRRRLSLSNFKRKNSSDIIS